MIIRRSQSLPFSLLSLFFFLSTSVQAQDDAFNCHITTNGQNYDLTKLAGEHVVTRTRDTPPTTMVDSLRFDLCADLNKQDGVADADQCATGTRACLTKTNKKSDNTDRVVAVIPIAQTSSLKPEYSTISSPSKGLSLIFHGASYNSGPDASPQPQSLNLTLLCTDTTSEPKFTSYNGSALNVEWSTVAACAGDGGGSEDDSDGGSGGGSGEEKEKEKVGSGIGWFFLVLLLAFLGYFGLGAYYNYSTYGATGVDLIPHRDFWQEVPYMVRDVLSHLCSSVRPRRTSQRGGYIAV